MVSIKDLKSYFIQGMVVKGNLYRADRLFKSLLKNIYLTYKIKGLNIITIAINNVKLFFTLRRFYLGGAVYFVPVIITNKTEDRNAVKALLRHSKKRGQSILINLVSEILLAKDFKGETIKYKNDFNLKVIRGIPFTRFLKKKKIKK